tara:strand:- start:6536 stop:6688 length:153 start_codon:yes stop_codon:yes gene_type:complete
MSKRTRPNYDVLCRGRSHYDVSRDVGKAKKTIRQRRDESARRADRRNGEW